MRRGPRFVGYIILVCIFILIVVLFALVFGRMDETVEAYGAVSPAEYANVSPEISGIIQAFRVEEGQKVEAGDTLFSLISDELRFEAERSRQALVEAQADLVNLQEEYRNLTTSESFELSALLADINEVEKQVEFASTNLERKKQLLDKNLISKDSFEQAKLSYDLTESKLRVLKARKNMLEGRYEREINEMRSRVKIAEQAYDLAQQKLGKAVVASPTSGTVLTPNLEDLVGTKAVEGKPILQIGNLSKMEFVASIEESSIPKVDVGQDAKIYINAFPHRQYKVFQGKVTEVSSAPQVAKSGVVFQAKIEIDEPWVEVSESRLYLRAGLSGKAKIVIQPRVRLIKKIFKGIAK